MENGEYDYCRWNVLEVDFEVVECFLYYVKGLFLYKWEEDEEKKN